MTGIREAVEPQQASVLIPTVGRVELLGACIRSVLDCEPGPNEVIVVDQSGGPAVHELVRALGAVDRVHVINDAGRGIARATNAGLAAASAPTVFVTHDDCTVAKDWIKVGIELMDRHPRAILTGRVLPPDGSRYVPSTIADPEPRDWTGTVAIGALYPANMVVDRVALLDFGAFDELPGLSRAAEDNDLCYRWLTAGRSLRYEPALVVWHQDWRSPQELIRTHIAYAHGQGALYAKYLVAGDRRILPLLWWDLGHGFKAPFRAVLNGTPRWTEPQWEMNFSLLSGIVRALPDARRVARQSARTRGR